MEGEKVRQPRRGRKPAASRLGVDKSGTSTLTMRQLGKLTADDVLHLGQPIPITNNGFPVAWLVPMTEAQRHRAELVATGRLRPGRPEGLKGWQPLPAREDGLSLSDAVIDMRQREGR